MLAWHKKYNIMRFTVIKHIFTVTNARNPKMFRFCIKFADIFMIFRNGFMGVSDPGIVYYG
jgi:hypothetical protein